MDSFYEHLIKKKMSYQDFLMILIIVLGAGLVTMATILLFPFLGMFWLLLPCLVVYIAYVLISKRFVEFEYFLTNDELDIDCITSKKRRRRLITVKCNAFDLLAAMNDPAYNEAVKDKEIKRVIMAASSPYSPGAYFAVFTKDGIRTLLVFEPTAKMLSAMRTYNPRKVFFS